MIGENKPTREQLKEVQEFVRYTSDHFNDMQLNTLVETLIENPADGFSFMEKSLNSILDSNSGETGQRIEEVIAKLDFLTKLKQNPALQKYVTRALESKTRTYMGDINMFCGLCGKDQLMRVYKAGNRNIMTCGNCNQFSIYFKGIKGI